jgi:hypothetical protein
MQKACSSNNVCDENVSIHVNALPVQKNVSKGPSAKSRFVGKLIKRIRNTANSRTPRNYLKYCVWIPTGREFILKDGKLEIAQAKQITTVYEYDLDFTPNPMELNLKGFPNTNSSVLGRLSKYVFRSSTRVAPST